MSKVIQVKQIKKTKQFKKIVGDANLSEMFDEMMGIKDAELAIIVPKFVIIRNNLRYICKILIQMCNLLGKSFPSYDEYFKEIVQFVIDIKTSNVLVDTDDFDEKYQGKEKAEMNMLYRKLKEDPNLKKVIVMCSKLNQHKMNFENLETLKLNFVNQEPGFKFILFNFSSLDFKALWNDSNMKDLIKNYILNVFHKLYKISHETYKCVTSPDVDVNKFSEILIIALGELRKQPQLHRCVNAFARIEKSVSLLREKFNDYYRESIASENPNMLVMNFIVDVSNQGGASASLTREFRIIIGYMQNIGNKSGKAKDPNVQKVFKMLNSSFSLMEKGSKKTKITTELDDFLPSKTNDSEQEDNAEDIKEPKNISVENIDDINDSSKFTDEFITLMNNKNEDSTLPDKNSDNITSDQQKKAISRKKNKKVVKLSELETLNV